MTTIVNAFGKACPMPLMMAKKEIDAGCRDLAVQVDNETAVKNVSRLGQKTGMAVSVDQIEGGWLVSLVAGDAQASAPEAAACSDCAPVPIPAVGGCGPAGCGYAVFVGKDHLGEGDPTLGRNLMKMAVYTFGEGDDVPASLLFMNGGVKLIAGPEAEPQVVDAAKKLAERGCEVLVCGTCLNFYGIADQLQVGEVSNMYDILGRMQEAAKVITL